MKSKFRMGWLFVCFDLPVVESEQMRLATHFRKYLLDSGYFMLQQSIYVRSCVSYEKTEKYINNIKRAAPCNGSICVFYLTDKQWSNSVRIEKADYKKSKYNVNIGEDAPKQITFW